MSTGQAEVDVRSHGQRALDDFGIRLGLAFLVTVLIGLPLIMVPAHRSWALLLALAISSCAMLLVVGLGRRAAGSSLLAGLLVAGVVVGCLVAATSSMADPRGFEVVAWVIDGMGGAVGVARGPWPSLTVYTAGTGIAVVVAASAGTSVPALSVVGSFTYCFGGSVICVAARRAFDSTRRATAAADAAESAHRVAVERWRARREADRELHDTVLSTLTLLSHGAVGVPQDRLRARCSRDLALLDGHGLGRQNTTDVPILNGAATADVVGWLQDVADLAAESRLQIAIHADRAALASVRLPVTVAAALGAALTQCVENVRLHAQVPAVDIAASVLNREFTVMVLDHGTGFTPAAVPPERIGLRISVRERLEDIGGTVAVRSLPGQGTSVVMRVPLGAEVVVRA